MDDINDRARDPASHEPGAVLNEVLSNPALLQSIAAAIRGTGGSASTEEACARFSFTAEVNSQHALPRSWRFRQR